MARIENTNIIIDQFSIAKKQPQQPFVHILTHMHTDHLKGLHDGWNYGPIYCSPNTKNMLLYRFPNINNITTLELNRPTTIKLSNTLEAQITFLDANHCVGAVLVLIEGYMGTILYSGDMRFDRNIFQYYSALYPPQLMNPEMQACSKHIDVLYLDNTFLKKKFQFPPKPAVLARVLSFIQQLLDLNQHTRIFVALDILGKEEVLVEIATHFNMYILVDEQRYERIKAMGLDPQLFTTNPDQSFIEVVRKNRLYQAINAVPGSIGIVLSGWVNHPTYRFNEKIYCLPYSLHSNYLELHQFVNSIRPTFIHPIVNEYPDENKIFYAQNSKFSKRDLAFNENLFEQEEIDYNREMNELRHLYCTPITEGYRPLVENIQLQKKIAQQLLPPRLPQCFTSEGMKAQMPIQTAFRKRYKVGLDSNRNEQEISRLKNQIQLKKKIIQGEEIQIIDDEDDCLSKDYSKKRSFQQVIDIDDKIQFQDEENIIQVDSLKQRIDALKPKYHLNKEKSRSSESEYNRQEQAKIVEQIRNKLKKKQLQQGLNFKNQFKQYKPANTLDNPRYKPFFNRINKSKPINNVSIADINLQKLADMKILKTKEQVKSYFMKYPKDIETIKHFIDLKPSHVFIS